ncbi:MAG: electron transfer flavoprotein subunit alpha/FixB family protein [Anaerolineaceae bacterium]|nr:MAG: electron transfer flavoprotein subunit alpha/FixB family protein [Anaerolineaceae bacterium]
MSQDIFVLIEHLRGQVADISYIMLAAARTLASSSGGQVAAVLLGKDAQKLAGNLAADKVLYADSPALTEFTSEAYQLTLAKLIEEQSPRAVLFGHTTIGADVAGWLSGKLSLPLVSSCVNFTSDGKFLSQTCGGKIMAEGDLPSPTILVTMIPGGYKSEQGQAAQASAIESFTPPALDNLRVALKKYIEPEAGDVDISKSPFLIAVGRGIQNKDNLDLPNELAAAINGTVCASRPVVDQGWLPTSRLVGKSGKRVKPKIYLALGISGAPEHVEGINESDVIVAVNTDANAPIFNVAKYGTTLDLLDLVPQLTEKVKQAKGG